MIKGFIYIGLYFTQFCVRMVSFEVLMRYIFSARVDLTKEDIREIIDEIQSTYPEGSETIMTLAEIFREEGKVKGIMEGLEKGLEKGRQEERLNTTIKLLTKRFGALPRDLKTEISELDLVTLDFPNQLIVFTIRLNIASIKVENNIKRRLT